MQSSTEEDVKSNDDASLEKHQRHLEINDENLKKKKKRKNYHPNLL